MLEHLRVKNLGVIDDISMDFSEGFVVISGETGTGKTLLTAGISFLLGSKLPRPSEKGDTLVEALICIGEDQYHIKRELKQTGRSKCYLNGSLISTSELKGFIENHIEIFGQNLAVSLQRPSFQLKMLDRAGQIDLKTLMLLRSQLGQLQRNREQVLELRDKALEAQDAKVGAIAELERANLSKPDEDMVLQERIETASHSEQIKSTIREALNQLDSDESNAILDQLARLFRTISKLPESEDIAHRVQNSLIDLSDVKSELVEALMTLEADDNQLEQLQERLYLLNVLKRKYGGSLAELIQLQQRYRGELRDSQNFAKKILELETEIDHLRKQLSEEEHSVRSRRSTTAADLTSELKRLLGELGLERVQLQFVLADNGDGAPVQTLLATNPGSPLLPLGEAASGGELSRIMLALCRVLGSDATTLIFDEIDAGVGGETALRVARSLKALGEKKQVIVVTHLAQVASFAGQHFVVDKEQSEISTRTKVNELTTYDSKISEISRMLSGQRDSDAARKHADELLHIGTQVQVTEKESFS